MVRTWVVYVSQGVGHELHNTISESEFFGPFTEQQANNLAAGLNALLDDGELECREATAMPLEHLSPDKILRRYKAETGEAGTDKD